MASKLVQMIYLNGPSSSGKTTLAKALQNAFEEPFLHVGIDKIIGWMPEKVNDWTGGNAPLGYSWEKSKDASGSLIQELKLGPYAQKIENTFREVVLALAKMGHRIIIDDVSCGKEQVEKWKSALQNFQVLWVGVNAPLAVLEKREKERSNRIQGSARAQFHKVHVGVNYDLEIDTQKAILAENVKTIKSRALRQESKEPSRDMEITLHKATQEDTSTIQNLARFYVYDISRYCGFLPSWETPENGLFECFDLSSYIEMPDKYAYLVKVKGELAGFALINKKGSAPEVDFNVGQFYIIAKFQGKGVGGYVAKQIFNQFPGIWETSQIPENQAAVDFWEKVVNDYSHGQFEKKLKMVLEPKPHPMVILKFTSQNK